MIGSIVIIVAAALTDVGVTGGFAHDIDLGTGKRGTTDPLSPDEPDQSESAAKQKPRVRA